MEDSDVAIIDVNAPAAPNVSEVIARHVIDLGKDERGNCVEPPFIPMCRLVHMELVRSIQKGSESILKLQESFITTGYSPGYGARFYVQPCDVDGNTILVTDEIREGWDPLWKEVDSEFERECGANPAFHFLKDKMFSVFDGNHRLFSWMQVTKDFPDSRRHHPRVMCTVLKADKGSLIEIESAMHTLNKLGQAVIETSWVLQIDRVRKILDRDLESYKRIMPPLRYSHFEKTMKSKRKKTWYSTKMPLEALMYILCENSIKSGENRLRSEMQEAARHGIIWSREKQEEKHADMMKDATKEWKTDGPKLAAILNPAYGGIVDKAVEMFSLTAKLAKEKVKDNRICNLDRARVFTGVTYMDADLRTELLVASSTPSLRKQYYHPDIIDDDRIKQWLHL